MYFCQTCVDEVCITDLTIQYDVFLPDVCGPGLYYGSNHSMLCLSPRHMWTRSVLRIYPFNLMSFSQTYVDQVSITDLSSSNHST